MENQNVAALAQGMDIINISDYGEALRNSGYKDIESAMAEIVDNSIQAKPTCIVAIIFNIQSVPNYHFFLYDN